MSLPPGPSRPGWQQVQCWIERPLRFWEKCAEEFGDVPILDLGSIGPTVLFGHPDAVREVFQLAPEPFECGPFNRYY